MAVLGVSAVLATAGCGERTVAFQPADGPGGSSPPVTATVTTTASAPSNVAPTGVTTDPASGVVVSRNGSLVCVRGRNGGQACTSGNGTVVVDGVTVSNGVVVSGGGGGAAVSTVTPQPTTGRVRLSGAVNWSGTATGTCEGHGTRVRTITANLPSLGRLAVRNVGDGVLKVSLDAKGQDYGLSYVGQGGPVRSTDSRTVIDDARLGRGTSAVVLNADFDC
jgi:hypothetical protein